MDNNTIKLLFALLNSALFGKNLTEEQKILFTDSLAKSLLESAKRHDVIHLAAKALCDNGLITKDHPFFPVCQKAQVMAIYRYEQLNFELIRVSELFEKSEIPFIPLKGSVVRKHYPEPWMRTSCDIDILVHKSDLSKAQNLLETEYGFTKSLETSCDIAYNTPSGMHVELHFSLLSDDVANNAGNFLENVWDFAKPKENCKYHHILSDEMFYYYHLAHMAKHFEDGGCGIRPFIDIFILDNLPDADKQKRDQMLKQGNLYEFAQGCRNLSEVWFGNQTHTKLTELMEIYLLKGGAFGTLANHVAIGQQKSGGKFGYAWSRFFPDLKFMKTHYGYVNKCIVLLPFAYAHRFFQVILRGNTKRSLHELKANSNVTEGTSNIAKQMLDELGLL